MTPTSWAEVNRRVGEDVALFMIKDGAPWNRYRAPGAWARGQLTSYETAYRNTRFLVNFGRSGTQRCDARLSWLQVGELDLQAPDPRD